MKKPYLTVLIYCALAYWCPAQPNLSLTNDVIINEFGTRQIFFSFASVEASSNNIFYGDKELRADQPNFWVLHNPNDKGALLPEYNHRFVFELKATNGISVLKTEMGEKMSTPPKSLTDEKLGKLSSIWNNHYGKFYDFPALTNLFDFPSNGVYIFELRCWAWQNSKKKFVLSDPIRVKVIKEDANNPLSNVQTNSPAM
jgi:hypothetical protein